MDTTPRMRRALPLLVAVLAGCTADCGSEAPTCPTGPVPSAGPTRTVTGLQRSVYWLDDGSQAAGAGPGSFHTPVEALVDTPGGYLRFAGAVAGDEVSVPGVPVGRYLLRRGFEPLVEHEASALDLAELRAGRPDAVWPGQATTLTAAVSGLTPWVFGDEVVLHASAPDSVLTLWGPTYPPHPIPGEVAAAGVMAWSAPLLDPARGDLSFLYQLGERTVAAGSLAGARYRAAGPALRLPSFAVADGATASLEVALEAPAAVGAMDLDAPLAELRALAPAVGPRGALRRLAVAVFAVPHPLAYPGPSGAQAELLRLDLPVAGDRATAEGLAWGRFHGPPWSEVRSVVATYAVPVLAPGARHPRDVELTVERSEPVAAGLAPSLAPALTPPRAPRIAGASALADQAGVCRSPVLSWSPPATGQPTRYEVTVWRLVVDVTESTVLEAVSSAVVRGTAFRIPEGALEPGRHYVATIRAQQIAGDAIDLPEGRGYPRAGAATITAPFTP